MKRFGLLLALLLTACTSDPYRNVYNNIKHRNEAMQSPIRRVITPIPSYDDYKEELERHTAD